MAGTRTRDFSQMSGIEGLKRLRGELKSGGDELPKKLQAVNKRLVTNVAEEARRDVPSRVPGKAPSRKPSDVGSLSRTRASIRGTAGQTSASVVAGGPKAPGFWGHEFGGGARPRTRQFAPHRGRTGYFLYPTVRRESEKAVDAWNEIFDELFP